MKIGENDQYNSFDSNRNGAFLLNEIFNDNHDHYVHQDVVISGDYEESLITDLKNITNIYTICLNSEKILFIKNYVQVGSNKIYFPNNDKDQLVYLDEYQDLWQGSLYDDDFMDQERLDCVETLLQQEIVSYLNAKSASIVGNAKEILGSSHLLNLIDGKNIEFLEKTQLLVVYMQQILSVSDAGYLFESFFKKYENEVDNVLRAGNLIASAFIPKLLTFLNKSNPMKSYYDWLVHTIADDAIRYYTTLSHFNFLIELIPRLDIILYKKGFTKKFNH